MSETIHLDSRRKFVPLVFKNAESLAPTGTISWSVFDIQNKPTPVDVSSDEWIYRNFAAVPRSQNDLHWLSPGQLSSEYQQIFAFIPSEIAALRGEVSYLRTFIEKMGRLRVIAVTITTLYPEPFRLLRDLPITLEMDEDDCVATWYEANISASAESEGDAIAYFKDALISAFELFEGTPEDKLGPLPRRQWGILKQSVTREK